MAVCALRIVFDGDKGGNTPSTHAALVHEIEKLKVELEDAKEELFISKKFNKIRGTELYSKDGADA